MIELAEYNSSIASEIDDIIFEINLAHDAFISAVIFGKRNRGRPFIGIPNLQSVQTRGSVSMTDREKQKSYPCTGSPKRRKAWTKRAIYWSGEKPAIRHQPGLLRHVLLILGLLIYEPYASSKHSGVLIFQQTFYRRWNFPGADGAHSP